LTIVSEPLFSIYRAGESEDGFEDELREQEVRMKEKRKQRVSVHFIGLNYI
jgi:hypothetical protein